MTGLAFIWAAFLALLFWAFWRFKADSVLLFLAGAWAFMIVAEIVLRVCNQIWPGLIPS